MKIEFYARTDVGKVRKENQDAFLVMEENNYFVVCDGMGGSAAGDFASRVAVEVIKNSQLIFTSSEVEEMLVFSDPIAKSFIKDSFVPIVSAWVANRVLFNLQEKYPLLSGMGTTVVSILFDKLYNVVHISHVGDSRVYRYRKNKLELLTRDHSKIEELLQQGKITQLEVATSELKSMVVRVLGPKRDVQVDYKMERMVQGDIYVLCSDGLNSEITDSTIEEVIRNNGGSVKEITEKLILSAKEAGGRDNITVITVKVVEENLKDFPVDLSNVCGKTFLVKLNEKDFSTQLSGFVKKVIKKCRIKVPKLAKKESIFNKPLVLVLFFLLVLVGGFSVFEYVNKNVGVKSIHEKKNFFYDIVVEIRVPKKEELEKYKMAKNEIDRKWLIKDWYDKIDELTERVEEGVSFSVFSKESENREVLYTNVISTQQVVLRLPVGEYYYSIDDGFKVVLYDDGTDKIEVLPINGFQKKKILILPKDWY